MMRFKGCPICAPKLYGLDGAIGINACQVVTVDCVDVASSDLDLKACLIRLLSLAT